MKKLLLTSLYTLLVVLAATFLPAIQTVHAQTIPDKKITIKTYFQATSAPKAGETTAWPLMVLFANNAVALDLPMDYGSCLQPGAFSFCGTAPLYNDKKIDSFEINTPTFTQTTVTTSNALFTFDPAHPNDLRPLKLSYVFLNDYWNPGLKQDRNVYITKIELLGPDNIIFKTYTPQDDSDTQGYGGKNLHQSMYFDYGLVNTDTVKQPDQYGFTLVFDKLEFESIVKNKSRENNTWSLGKEGSFNIISNELYTLFKNKYSSTTTTPPVTAVTKTCSVSLSEVSVVAGTPVTATFRGTSSRSTTEPVQIYLKKIDSTPIIPSPAGTVEVAYPPNYYYKFTTTCATGNSQGCTGTVTIPPQVVGKYQVHCDLYTAPNACSGNPNCAYENQGGTFACAGWQSCSTSDNQVLEVTAAPAPPIQTPTTRNPDYNGNHVVDIFDYNILVRNYGKTDCSLNLVGECAINGEDFNQLVSVFGKEY